MSLTTKHIITLQQLKGCGKVTTFKIAEYFQQKNIEIISEEQLLAFYIECKENKIARAMKEYSLEEIKAASAEAANIIKLSEQNDIGIVSYYEDIYPLRLKELKDKSGLFNGPIILYYKGDINIADYPSVAIIGTREPTKEGVMAGEYYGKLFAEKGFNIVSGLAVGCDTAGHHGALSAEKGMTTCFLAHGLDSIYPTVNKGLADKIVSKGGLLLSEYPIGTSVRPNQFVERDRLQAGMAQATIVIQTGLKGGTMHAANATLETAKPLYVIEYKNIQDHEKVEGNKLLNRKGAKYLSSKNNIENIIQEININKRCASNFQQKIDFFGEEYLKKPTIKGVIFDMDMTLVDTSKSEKFRQARDWKTVYSLIPSFSLYKGFDKVFEYIRDKNIKVAIVSTAPRPYLTKIVNHFNIPNTTIIGYHDASIKPKPNQFNLALQHMNLNAENVISFGDRAIDIEASNASGIKGAACFWGTKEPEKLSKSQFYKKIESVDDIITLIK